MKVKESCMPRCAKNARLSAGDDVLIKRGREIANMHSDKERNIDNVHNGKQGLDTSYHTRAFL